MKETKSDEINLFAALRNLLQVPIEKVKNLLKNRHLFHQNANSGAGEFFAHTIIINTGLLYFKRRQDIPLF